MGKLSKDFLDNFIDFVYWRRYKDTTYIVSSNGKVYNTKTKNIMKERLHGKYVIVTISIKGKTKSLRVHRLLAELFISNPLNKPYVNHIDGNKQNNNINNLEWVTNSENILHAYRIGLISVNSKKVIQYDLNFKEINRFESIKEASQKTDSSYDRILDVCNKIQHTTNGYIWRFVDDEIKKDNIPIIPKVGKNGCKEVIQYDLNNNEIARFNSIKEAENITKISSKRISENIRTSGIAGGYKWKFVDEKDKNKHFDYVIQYDLENKEIERFKTIAEASKKSNICSSSISKVCRGERNIAGGYIWKYE